MLRKSNLTISSTLSEMSNFIRQSENEPMVGGVSLPEGLTDVTAPAHSCLILMLLDNERPALSVHIDNALLVRLLKGQKHWPGGRRQSGEKMFWHCGERDGEV